jgi:cold shock CspA family protein
MRGRVVRWFPSRGFGFIKADNDREFFAHASAIISDDLYKNLEVGAVVHFDLQPALQPNRAPMAAHITRAPAGANPMDPNADGGRA